jgi:molecular chaperone DnaK
MVKEAELHAEEDKKKKEVIEQKNQLDNLIFTTEKALQEHGDKISEEEKKNVATAIENAKKTMEKDDVDSFKRATEEISKASHRLAEVMYTQPSTQQTGASAHAGEQPDSEKQSKSQRDNDVIDAEFEEAA